METEQKWQKIIEITVGDEQNWFVWPWTKMLRFQLKLLCTISLKHRISIHFMYVEHIFRRYRSFQYFSISTNGDVLLRDYIVHGKNRSSFASHRSRYCTLKIIECGRTTWLEIVGKRKRYGYNLCCGDTGLCCGSLINSVHLIISAIIHLMVKSKASDKR